MFEYQNKKILIVEDDPVIGMIESEVLKKRGYIVSIVPSGEDAVEMVKSGEFFDLILMDIDLGEGITGTDASMRILEHMEIPIIFVSNHTEPEILDKTDGINSYGYVVKNSGDTVMLASIRMAFRLYDEKIKVQRHKDKMADLNAELKSTLDILEKTNIELVDANNDLQHKENILRESEGKYRSLAEASPVAIIVHQYGEIVYINHTGRKLFGADDDTEIIGKEFIKRIRKDFRDREIERIKRVNEEKEKIPPNEEVMLKLNGDEFYAEVISVPFSHKEEYAVQVLVRDISERKKMEKAFVEQKNLLDSVINAIPAPIFFKDINGRYTGCNRAFCISAGLQKVNIIGKTQFEISSEKTALKFTESDQSVLTSGTDSVYETDVKYADGLTRKIMFHKACLYNPEGLANGIVGVMIDITGLKNIENSLRKIKEEFEKVQEQAHIGSWIWYTENDMVDGDDELYNIFGIDKDVFNGKLKYVLDKFIFNEDKEKINTFLKLLYEKETTDIDFRIVLDNDVVKVIWLSVREIETNENGSINFVKGFMQDITERKKAEEKLEKMINEKESLLRELQHRVKNNLAMISGLIGLESIKAEDDKTVGVLNNLRNRISALEKLYTSLYQTGDVKGIRLDNYISSIAQSLMNTYVSGMKNITLDTELAPLTITIKNAASIGLIINELLINAFKYAFPDGHDGKIMIGLSVNKNSYEIYVADNGVGPAADFDINNSTGSGVMIIGMLTEHMGGRFEFKRESRTEFRLIIPFNDEYN